MTMLDILEIIGNRPDDSDLSGRNGDGRVYTEDGCIPEYVPT